MFLVLDSALDIVSKVKFPTDSLLLVVADLPASLRQRCLLQGWNWQHLYQPHAWTGWRCWPGAQASLPTLWWLEDTLRSGLQCSQLWVPLQQRSALSHPTLFFFFFFLGGGCWKSRFLFNQRSGYYLLAESWMFAENKTAFQWVKIQSTKNEKKVEGEGGHLLQCIFMLFAMAAIGADRCRCKIWSHLLLCEILPSGLGKCYFALGSRLLSVDVMFFQPVRKISWADTIEKGMSYAKYIDNVCVNKWTCSFHLKTSRNSQL